MSRKVKVGDRVRVLGNTCYEGDIEIGSVARAVTVNACSIYIDVLDKDGDNVELWDREYELIEEEEKGRKRSDDYSIQSEIYRANCPKNEDAKLEQRAGKMKPPFPTKFRVGDKCRVTEDTVFFSEGDIVTISNVLHDGTYNVLELGDKNEWNIAECRLKIVEPREEIDLNSSVSENASATQVGGNHYAKLAIQPMEYCLKNGLNYAQSNAIKYITRYNDKNGIEDLKKAIHCIELLIEYESAIESKILEENND